MKYIPTIGLEVHAELHTRTKMFCDSANDPDETLPNVHVCPVCMAHPGTLPVINREAVRHILRIGSAVGGTIADYSEFDRKSYFYPDIPKGYQISQYQYPLVVGGELSGIAITRVHLEEDTARSMHFAGKSLVDFNRAGIPLMELVTEPVMRDAQTAGRFARELQLLLRTLGASEANLEKGEMRVEANVSVMRIDADNETPINADNTKKLLYEELSYKIRGAAFAVYNALGSGHKESIYQNALAEQLKKSGLRFEKEKNIGVHYEGKRMGSYQPDFLIEDSVIVELKALPFVGKIEKEQLFFYLKNSPYRLGFVINFGALPIQIERIVYDSIRDNPRTNQRVSASLGTKVEIKNLNSFRSVENAIAFEIKRQTALIESGGKVVQETRGWNEAKQETFHQRFKEGSADYRYFPEPDLPKLLLSDIPELSREAIRASLPELPWDRRKRYRETFGIPPEYIETFLNDNQLGELFERTVALQPDAYKLIANYICSDIVGLMKTLPHARLEHITPEGLGALMKGVLQKSISSRGAKDALVQALTTGGDLARIMEQYLQQNNTEELTKVVEAVIAKEERAVQEYQQGKGTALQYLLGKAMKESGGAGNPSELGKLLKERLK